MAKKTVILVILDGWGIGKEDIYNPIYMVKPKLFSYLESRFPCGALQASGIAVGLPWGEEGNSEVGHLTIGAGAIMYQYLPRINAAIERGDFFKNETLLGAIHHVQQNQSALNLVGLISQGNVHASLGHLTALIKLAADNGVAAVNLHAFSDGKDSPQRFVLELLQKVVGARLASLSGRYYALDREKHWDRTQLCYEALTGKTTVVDAIEPFIREQYRKNLSDEYLQPVSIGPDRRGIADGDAIVFFNFREDSIRQIAEPFVNPDFKQFPAAPPANSYAAAMTSYFERLKINVAFPPEEVKQPLGKVIADNGKTQLRLAETEKYGHVTYFLNGLKDASLPNEYRVLIPSKNIAHPDEHPEMMAEEITNRLIQALEDGEMDFIVANYANADVMAHTGNYEAAVAAIKTLDGELERLVKTVLARGATLLITADHGNIEQMVNPRTGLAEAKHNVSPVPIYIVAADLEKTKDAAAVKRVMAEPVGFLADVAPTILEIMGIAKPPEMTGESLLKKLS